MVERLITENIWAIADGENPSPFIIRYREPVLRPSEVSGYNLCLRIVWVYAEENEGVLPTEDESSAMETFENRLCDSFEHDALAVLAAVLTFDGARQWVFYTHDVPVCGERINAMPQEDEPYPIELDAFDDPAWKNLKDEILSRVDTGTA